MGDKPCELKLQMLGNGTTALDKDFESCLGSAAGACLEEQGHIPQIEIRVSGFWNKSLSLDWNRTTDEAIRTWQNEQQTTELGAYGVALVLVGTVVGLKAFQVSRKFSGFDFWLTEKGKVYPFQEAARLEVTGIRHGSESDKKSRLKEKMNRLYEYPSPLPAFIVVVEFGEPGALVEKI